MITVRFYHDTRKESKSGEYPVSLKITNNRKAFYIATGIKTKQKHWDGMVTRGDSNHRAKNAKLRYLMDEAEKIVYDEEKKGCVGNDRLKKRITELINPQKVKTTIIDVFDEFIKTKSKRGTIKLYETVKNNIKRYDADATFDTITPEWLVKYEKKMLSDGFKVNYVSVNMRNIRAVFNYAIDKEYTSLYPFRKYKIKREQTEKRSLTIEQVRELLNYPCEEYQEKYRDIFFLMIYMIGINAVDLFNMPPLKSNRVSYIRQKTNKETASNVRRIEFMIQPEAEEIIKKYAGKNYMLNFLDTRENYEVFTRRMNAALKKIGKREKKNITPAFPGLTSYWARHTWATLAAELDIPKETIGAALGHAGTSVTDIYINFDKKKIDEANRKVIDYILQKN